MANQRWSIKPHWILAALVGITFLIYYRTLQAEFLLWDDGLNITSNLYLNPVTWKGLHQFWRTPYEGLYIPVTYNLWGLLVLAGPFDVVSPPDAYVFHLANLIVHSCTVVLVFFLVRMILWELRETNEAFSVGNPSEMTINLCSGIGALLFSIHPLHVEPVAWITGMKDVLSGFFSHLVLLFYLTHVRCLRLPHFNRTRSNILFGLALVSYLLAVLSKPSAICIPLSAGIMDWLIFRRPFKKVFWSVFIFLAGVAPIVISINRAAHVEQVMEMQYSWKEKMVVALDAIGFYFSKLVLPLKLAPDYGRTPKALLTQHWKEFLWLIPMVTMGLISLAPKRIVWISCFLLFLVPLFPALGFVPFGYQAFSTTADRYVYSALLGPSVALACILMLYWRLTWVSAAIGVAILVLSIKSFLQTQYWHDTQTLFEHNEKVTPHSYVTHAKLGQLSLKRGDLEATERYLERALEIKPNAHEVHNMYGNLLMARKEVPQAIEKFSTALRIEPDFTEAINNLGNAFLAMGDLEKAKTQFERAIRTAPKFPDGYNNLGVVMGHQNHIDEAIENFQMAILLKPWFTDANENLVLACVRFSKLESAEQFYSRLSKNRPLAAQELYGLGLIYFHQGKLAQSKELLIQALKLNPDLHVAYFRLGNIYEQLGNSREAMQSYSHATQVHPHYSEAYLNLGNLAGEAGKTAEAIEYYLLALKYNPKIPEAYYNLGLECFNLGRMEEAIKYLRQAVELNPQFEEALGLLGEIHQANGNQNEAEKWMKKAETLRKSRTGSDD